MSDITLDRFDPWDCAVSDDPYPYHQLLREQSPVHEVRGLWMLSRYDDIRAAMRNTEVFSNNLVYVGQPIDVPDLDTIDAQWDPQPEVPSRSALGYDGDTSNPAVEPVALLAALAEIDPPEHTRIRRLIARPMNVTKTGQLEPAVRALVDDAFDDLAAEVRDHGSAEFKNVFSLPLTLRVTSLIMDIPHPDLPKLGRWAEESLAAFSLDPAARRVADSAYAPYARYFLDEFTTRSASLAEVSGGPDLMRKLLQEDDQGDKLTREEFAANAAVLFRAGFETTASVLVTGLRALIDHPEQMELLRADPSLIPSAVEEMLRWDGPVLGLIRVTRDDVQVHDRTIPKGSFVQLLFSSANRDETQFDDPHTFRVDRSPKDHLAFGAFRHLCIGSELARMEARLALEALIQRTRDIRQVGPAPVSRHVILRGRTMLPITFTTA